MNIEDVSMGAYTKCPDCGGTGVNQLPHTNPRSCWACPGCKGTGYVLRLLSVADLRRILGLEVPAEPEPETEPYEESAQRKTQPAEPATQCEEIRQDAARSPAALPEESPEMRQQCVRCDGSGKIWGEPGNEVTWPVAKRLPMDSALALLMFPPRECPDCRGTGFLDGPASKPASKVKNEQEKNR